MLWESKNSCSNFGTSVKPPCAKTVSNRAPRSGFLNSYLKEEEEDEVGELGDGMARLFG